MSKWYQFTGAENDVIISTKIAIARNVKGYNFTIKLSPQEKTEISDKVTDVLDEKLPGKFMVTRMSDINRDVAISLAERNLVSPEFVSSIEGRNFITTADESLSIMICEEDHLKIQALLPGLELEKAYELSNTLDNILDESLLFSFDRKLGYLTQCPTNIGTAMRASVTMQLPALHMKGQISRLSTMVSKLGLVLTGAYGEGDNPTGSLYQLCNQVTLGISEKAAIENLKSISLSIIEQERLLRKEMMTSLKFQDMFWRSYGVLKNARVISFEEFMNAAAVIKVGIDSGEINVSPEKINELIFTMQPATLNVLYGERLDRQVRDVKRAEHVRKVFA